MTLQHWSEHLNVTKTNKNLFFKSLFEALNIEEMKIHIL